MKVVTNPIHTYACDFPDCRETIANSVEREDAKRPPAGWCRLMLIHDHPVPPETSSIVDLCPKHFVYFWDEVLERPQLGVRDRDSR